MNLNRLILITFILLLMSCEKPNTQSDMVIDIDNNTYNAVTIGNQVWLKENLKTTRLNDGTDIQYISNIQKWRATITPGYCYYDNDKDTYKDMYGALYNWYSVSTGKLCPIGWRVPINNDWQTLFNYLGGSDIAGGKLKALSNWLTPNTGATDEVGFTALPGGFRDYTGEYLNLERIGFWWSLTEYTVETQYEPISEQAYNILLHTYSNSIFGIKYVDYPYSKTAGMSIRCIKN